MAKGGDTKPVWDLPDEDFDYMIANDMETGRPEAR
jgi:hypothetical protein